MTRAIVLPPRPFSALLLCAATGMALSACSSAGDYPSLAYRPVERATPVAADTVEPVQLPPPSADLTTRIDGLVAAARKSDEAFAARRPAAERAVAAAGGRGSDSWVSAQVAVSALQTTRDPAIAALAELDTLFADARVEGPVEPSPSAVAIGTARDEVQERVTAQAEVMTRLDGRLGA